MFYNCMDLYILMIFMYSVLPKFMHIFICLKSSLGDFFSPIGIVQPIPTNISVDDLEVFGAIMSFHMRYLPMGIFAPFIASAVIIVKSTT